MIDYKKLNQGQLNKKYHQACLNGYIKVVKYLLTSSELTLHAKICQNNYYGFRLACEGGHLNIMQYLLTSPELLKHADIHANNDLGFIAACEFERIDIVKYLVFQQHIPLTVYIQKFLTESKNQNAYDNEKILKLFEIRDTYLDLNNSLSHKVKNEYKKTKI